MAVVASSTEGDSIISVIVLVVLVEEIIAMSYCGRAFRSELWLRIWLLLVLLWGIKVSIPHNNQSVISDAVFEALYLKK